MRADFIPIDLKKNRERPAELNRNREIEKLRREMEQKIAAAERQGYEQGFAEGIRKGSETQLNEGRAVMNTMQGIMEEVGSFKEKTLKASEKQILDVCFSIAETIVHQEISSDRSVILSVLKAAFRNIVERENIKIRLNPEDFQYMVEMKSDFINTMDGVRNVFFEEDESISRGGAILETASGVVDARINEQLKEVKAGMINLKAS